MCLSSRVILSNFNGKDAGDAFIGFLWNPPMVGVPSAGYFFFRRCKRLFLFLSNWFNFNDSTLDLKFPWEQNAIQDLMRDDDWMRKSVLVLHERQYDLPRAPTAHEHILDPVFDEDEQVIFHYSTGKVASVLLVESAYGFDMGIHHEDSIALKTELFQKMNQTFQVYSVNVTEVERDLQAWTFKGNYSVD